MRFPAVVAGAALLVTGVAGCGGEAEDGAARASGPGSPLVEGLVVPDGTRLVGPVFPRPAAAGRDDGSRSWVALLELEGDPFAAWDDLARQAQARGAPLPPSGVCAWHDRGHHQGSMRPPQEVGDGPRPQGNDVLRCEASAQGPTGDGELVSLAATLWWGSEGAELGLEVAAGETLGQGPVAVSPGDPDAVRAFPEGAFAPAPASARVDLPPAPPAAHAAEPGDRFGAETDCFESGYDRLRVPAGARLLGGGVTPVLSSFGAVLAVRDPEAALREIAAQLDPSGPADGEGAATVERAEADGRPVWRLDSSVGAGGGSCEMWSSPDGHAILAIAHND